MRKNKFGIIMLTATAVILTSCDGDPFKESDFVNKLFPSGLWDLIIQLLALIVLFVAVFFLAYKPVKKMLNNRKEYVEKTINDAEEAKRVALDAASKKEETIEEGRVEAAKIVAAAKAQAQTQANAIVAEAVETAAAKRKQADEDIKAAEEKSRQEVKGEIIDLAIAASGHLLGREVSEEDNKRLLDEFVDSLNEGGK